MFAKGLTQHEIAAHLRDFCGNEVSVELISQVTDAIGEELAEWQSRPLEEVYAVLWVDCIFVKIRDGAVASRPVYVVIGIDLEGRREVLGLWIGSGGEGARHWTVVCNEIKNRGVKDVIFVCCDGLAGLPDALSSVWPQVTVQQCIVHMIRSSCRLVGRKDAGPVAKALKSVYSAPSEQAAEQALGQVEREWGGRYPAADRLVARELGDLHPLLEPEPACAPRVVHHERDRGLKRADPQHGAPARALPERGCRQEDDLHLRARLRQVPP